MRLQTVTMEAAESGDDIPRTKAAFAAARQGVELAMKGRRGIELSAGSSSAPVKMLEREIESVIRRTILQRYPEDSVIGEETPVPVPSGIGYEWIVDPIDGTDAFCARTKLWAVSIGLCASGCPRIGVVMAPDLKTIYQTSVGSVAYKNAKLIPAVERRSPRRLILGFGWYGKDCISLRNRIADDLGEVGFRCQWNIPAAIGLSWVADQQLTGYFEDGIASWDVAAGAAIAVAAGAEVGIDPWLMSSRRSGRILAAPPSVYPVLLEHLARREWCGGN
jgi:myo-inositol-1(or 4)-monophosphatase